MTAEQIMKMICEVFAVTKLAIENKMCGGILRSAKTTLNTLAIFADDLEPSGLPAPIALDLASKLSIVARGHDYGGIGVSESRKRNTVAGKRRLERQTESLSVIR